MFGTRNDDIIAIHHILQMARLLLHPDKPMEADQDQWMLLAALDWLWVSQEVEVPCSYCKWFLAFHTLCYAFFEVFIENFIQGIV
jgi:hypothetical protein